MYVFAKVSEQVASQRIRLPLDHGINVAPSGRFPSLRSIPEGSRIPGICTVAQARRMMSLMAEWRAILPAFLGSIILSEWYLPVFT
jgi:hypothetical protein